MILAPEQAYVCVYALDTSDLCAHLTIGADIDVQKMPSGCVTVEGRDGSEHYPCVRAFIEAYGLGQVVEVHPMQTVRDMMQARKDAEATGKAMFWITGAVVVVGLLLWAGWLCFR